MSQLNNLHNIVVAFEYVYIILSELTHTLMEVKGITHVVMNGVTHNSCCERKGIHTKRRPVKRKYYLQFFQKLRSCLMELQKCTYFFKPPKRFSC